MDTAGREFVRKKFLCLIHCSKADKLSVELAELRNRRFLRRRLHT
jgi:hypothetical protein